MHKWLTFNNFVVSLKIKDMKNFRFSYYGQAITKEAFEKNVPQNWEELIDEEGTYSYGGYRATEVES